MKLRHLSRLPRQAAYMLGMGSAGIGALAVVAFVLVLVYVFVVGGADLVWHWLHR